MLEFNKSLIKQTSFKVPTLAKVFFTPETIEELQLFLAKNTQDILFLGLGSNLLITKFDGVVISTKNLNQLNFTKTTLTASCGCSLAKVSRTAQQNNLNGLAFFSGIPGTIGGALAMNAGAFGSETWDNISKVTTINNQGELQTRDKTDFTIAYRQVTGFANEYFVEASFDLSDAKDDTNIKSLLKQRNETQPIGLASCGSVFKNPPNNFAAKIIESLDLKGFCIGDACVSEKHANFIINKKNATAQQILNLIQHIQKIAKEKLNILLETEVKIV